MSKPEPALIAAQNISVAWAKIIKHVFDHHCHEISPLLVTVLGSNITPVPEVSAVRDALDEFLDKQGEKSVHTVANTIFPDSIWSISRGDRAFLFKTYRRALPRYAALDRLNRGGTYFSRLIAFDVDAVTGNRIGHLPEGAIPENGNQLEHIIKVFLAGKVKRDSALQAAVFDPARDHSTELYQSFPCMQQLSFIKTDDGTLAMNAFYATQQIVRKAYGNLLGLFRLGQFMAGEMKLPFGRLNITVGVEKFTDVNKTSAEFEPVLDAARAAVVSAEGKQ